MSPATHVRVRRRVYTLDHTPRSGVDRQHSVCRGPPPGRPVFELREVEVMSDERHVLLQVFLLLLLHSLSFLHKLKSDPNAKRNEKPKEVLR